MHLHAIMFQRVLQVPQCPETASGPDAALRLADGGRLHTDSYGAMPPAFSALSFHFEGFTILAGT